MLNLYVQKKEERQYKKGFFDVTHEYVLHFFAGKIDC